MFQAYSPRAACHVDVLGPPRGPTHRGEVWEDAGASRNAVARPAARRRRVGDGECGNTAELLGVARFRLSDADMAVLSGLT